MKNFIEMNGRVTSCVRTMKLFLMVLVLLTGYSDGYKIFYMDDTCRLVPTQPAMDILVGASGPNSTGILRAAHYPPYSRGVLTKLASLNETGILRSERYPAYPSGMNCSVNLVPPKGYGIVLSIRFVNLRNTYCTDYLRFTAGYSSFTECGPRVDDDTESRSYKFTDSVMVTFYTEYRSYSDITSGFQLTFTAFNYSTSGICSSGDFLCHNHNCIWDGLTCDGHNNCGDLSDESPFAETDCGYPRSSIHYLQVFLSLFILVLVTCATCFYCCRRHRTLVYSGAVVHGPLAATSSEPVNYGTYGISPYKGPQFPAGELMDQSAYTYSMPSVQTPPYPPYGPVLSSTGLEPVVDSSQSPPYPVSDMSGRPPSPPPPYTQKYSK